MSISWRLVSFTQSQSTPYNIIRCNQDRFLYYLSVYVKSFKELFLNLLVSGWFLKSECKSTNYFSNKQEILRKSLKINSYLTVQRRFRSLSTSFSLYYTREAHAARVHPHRCVLEKKKGILKGKPNVEVFMGDVNWIWKPQPEGGETTSSRKGKKHT